MDMCLLVIILMIPSSYGLFLMPSNGAGTSDSMTKQDGIQAENHLSAHHGWTVFSEEEDGNEYQTNSEARTADLPSSSFAGIVSDSDSSIPPSSSIEQQSLTILTTNYVPSLMDTSSKAEMTRQSSATAQPSETRSPTLQSRMSSPSNTSNGVFDTTEDFNSTSTENSTDTEKVVTTSKSQSPMSSYSQIFQHTLVWLNDTYILSILIPVCAGFLFASAVIVTVATCRCLRRKCLRRRIRSKVLPESIKSMRKSDRTRLLAESSDEEF